MQKYYRIPLLFFCLAAALGLFLRWQFVIPTPGVRYTYFLHAHSHVMFLGWVFNVLYLSFVEHNLPDRGRKDYLKVFAALQVLVVAMLVSFPLQGYGLFSIIFSTLHTLAVLVFIPIFFRRTKSDHRVSTWFARMAWIFFFISTAGPFSLGYLMAHGLGQTVWYNFSIYYYLHFQYNGFFLFGVFSLLFQLLEKKQVGFSHTRTLLFGKWMAVACIPAYALSLLFTKPGIIFNVIGAMAAILQLTVIILAVYEVFCMRFVLHKCFSGLSQGLFRFILLCLVVKSVFQLVSAHPAIAEMAYSLRPVVIAYLHLVLVGVITLFLLTWYYEMNLVKKPIAKLAVILVVAGFVASETCLVLIPWWDSLVGGGAVRSSTAVFTVSILMLAGSVLFYSAFLSNTMVRRRSAALRDVKT